MARVLGLRLLRIEAGLVVSPAEMREQVAETRAVGAGLAAAQRCIEDGAASLAASRGEAR